MREMSRRPTALAAHHCGHRLDGLTGPGRGIRLFRHPRRNPATLVARDAGRVRAPISRRSRWIIAVAVTTAIVVNAGVVWMYWRLTQGDAARPYAGITVELAQRAKSDPKTPPAPGVPGDLSVVLTNGNDFPVRITSIARAAGAVVADDEHLDAGCLVPLVGLNQERFEVQWDVPKNTVGAFTIPEALTMRGGSAEECRGAVFTVPVRATGIVADDGSR